METIKPGSFGNGFVVYFHVKSLLICMKMLKVFDLSEPTSKIGAGLPFPPEQPRVCHRHVNPVCGDLEEILSPSSCPSSFFLSPQNHSPNEQTCNPVGGVKLAISFFKCLFSSYGFRWFLGLTSSEPQ